MNSIFSKYFFLNKCKQFFYLHSKLILFALLTSACLMLTMQFFSSWHKNSLFNNFSKGSESLVIGKILHDQFDSKEKNVGNLYIVNFEDSKIHENPQICIDLVYANLVKKNKTKVYSFIPYISQYGFQGIVFSFLFNKLDLSIDFLHLLTAFLTALVLSILSYQYSRLFSVGFGFCFFVVCFLSPWLTNFARNLYWVPFTWFLPAVISNWCFILKNNLKNKLIVYTVFTIGICIKSLCGYEYLSSVILLAVAPYLFLSITQKKIEYLKVAFTLCILSIIGFVIAVLIHTIQRSDNFFDGLIYLIKNDIERRCYGSADQFEHPLIKKSLDASVIEVLKIYILNWYSNVLYVGSIIGQKFWKLCLISVLLIIVEFVFFSKNRAKMYFALCLSFIFPPLSWFMLAKAHTYIHTHLNYVLWYFGFVQSLYFVILGFVSSRLSEIFKRLN